MKKAFYPASRAHHALCMAIDFGMKFKKRDGFWTNEGLIGLLHAHSYQIEIAEESLHILQPLPTDIIHIPSRPALTSDEVRVVFRDGKPFHWPEFYE